MEAVVFEDSPLADYLEGKWSTTPISVDSARQAFLTSPPGDGSQEAEDTPSYGDGDASSNTSSPSFAPRGKPTLRTKFRHRLPPPLRLAMPANSTVATIHNTCSVRLAEDMIGFGANEILQKAVNSRLGSADNARFLERFRYLIVASQLLNAQSYLGQGPYALSRDAALPTRDAPHVGAFTLAGVVVTASFSFGMAWLIYWAKGGASSSAGKGRMCVLLVVVILLAITLYTYMRRQWLQYLRQQSLLEISGFIVKAHDFDTAAAGGLTLVQEVELVSRGYRMYVELSLTRGALSLTDIQQYSSSSDQPA